MNPGRYLPSAQFVVIVGSIVLSGGLVLAAQYVTHTPAPSAAIQSTSGSQAAADTNWQATLQAIQGQNSVSAPTPPSQDIVNTLLDAAQSSNLTTAVGRTLLINISNAKSQGLGSDIPTQDQLVEAAKAQINTTASAKQYAQADLTIVGQTPATLKAYGNGVMQAINAHPKAAYDAVVTAVAKAADTSDATTLAQLPAIQKEYAALASGLAQVPVPSTLIPLHLKIVNDMSLIAATLPDMGTVLTDPLRGIAALQSYSSLNGEMERVFINIAQSLQQNGILFTKDEPGSAWADLLSLH